MFTMNIKRRNPNYKVWTTQGYVICGKEYEKIAGIKKPKVNLSESELVEVITDILVNYHITGEPVKIKIDNNRYYVEYKTCDPLGMRWLNLGNIILTGKF